MTTAADIAFPDPGPVPDLVWLPLDALVVDHQYQRDAKTKASAKNILRIAENFSWAKFQPITVTPRSDGGYAVIDGQHRVEAARLHPAVSKVPALVVTAPGLRAEARAFTAINRDRVNVNYLQLHHAGIAAGEPDPLHIKDVCDKAGIKVPRNPTPAGDLKPNMTMALGAIKKGLEVFGDGAVIAALIALREAWPDRFGHLRGQVITAMVHFFAAHRNHDIDSARLKSVLAGFTAVELETTGRAVKTAFGGNVTAAIRATITRAYNQRLSADRRLPEA